MMQDLQRRAEEKKSIDVMGRKMGLEMAIASFNSDGDEPEIRTQEILVRAAAFTKYVIGDANGPTLAANRN